jgi:2-polyprenyl-6-methoxyphenol hydroxylase-like FAD-dependent oxidoreductase
MASLNIAIVGAGPAGCTLARLLQRSETPIQVTIFEREASPDARTQGGTLDLHTETGIAALKKAELYDEFLKLSRFDAEGQWSNTSYENYANLFNSTCSLQ